MVLLYTGGDFGLPLRYRYWLGAIGGAILSSVIYGVLLRVIIAAVNCTFAHFIRLIRLFISYFLIVTAVFTACLKRQQN